MNSITETLPAFSLAATSFANDRPKSHRMAERMEVGGHNVHIDVFEPAGGGDVSHAHTVLLLHGVGGLLGDTGLMRRAAKRLAAAGCHACVVHYFNTTGTLFATHTTVHEHALEWRAGIIEIAHNYARLRSEPVGLLGYSLGGFLAVSAAESTGDIGAVAVLGGGLCEELEQSDPSHFPPLLVLHGGKDARVPIERADALVQMGRRAGAIVENVVYPNEGHTLGASAERDAFDRVAEFFAARLDAGADS